MYFRWLFTDKKTKLVYSNGLSLLYLSSPFSDSGNRTAYKTCIKLSINYQDTQKNAAYPKKIPYEILQNGNRKSLISKEQRKPIFLPKLFNKLK